MSFKTPLSYKTIYNYSLSDRFGAMTLFAAEERYWKKFKQDNADI